MSEKLLTAEQLAERWQLPTSQIYRLSRSGAIPVLKFGKYYRYAVAAIEALERGEGRAA